MRKKNLALLVSGFLILETFRLDAQEADTLTNLPNLLLPRFTAGIVKLKSGVVNKAILNYDLVNQQMVFLQRKLTLVVDEPEKIDTIFLANRIFVPFPKGFYEVLLKEGNVTLFRQHKAYVESPGMPIGYGAKSQTAAPNYVHQIYGPTGVIKLKLPDDFKVTDDSQYWIRIGEKMSPFENRKQLLKILKEKQKELDIFITRNKTDFKKSGDVRDLIIYYLSLK